MANNISSGTAGGAKVNKADRGESKRKAKYGVAAVTIATDRRTGKTFYPNAISKGSDRAKGKIAVSYQSIRRAK